MTIAQKGRHPLCQETLDADESFDKAIKKQFGKYANRFDVEKKDYNAETLAAYDRKIRAHKAWMAFMRRNRDKKPACSSRDNGPGMTP